MEEKPVNSEVSSTPPPAPAQPEVQPPPPPVPQQSTPVSGDEPKDFMVALLLSILVGSLGIDRFYLGYIGLGILKLVTFGGFGIWYIIDVILIATNKLPDAKGRPLHKS